MLKTVIAFRFSLSPGLNFVGSRWWALPLGMCLLAGCAHLPQPAPSDVPHPNMDRSLMQSVRQIQQVTDNLRAAHSVAWHGVYQGFPMNDGTAPSDGGYPVPQISASAPKAGPLATRMYVQWSGSANILGKALAQKLGWRYQDSSGLGGQLDVSVYGRNESVLSILKTMAAQLPDSVSLQVTPGHINLCASGAGSTAGVGGWSGK
ncbi:hypothetical protein [Acidithiobacillus albertensis]|uniref:hypothetical protein n=1 Tax=Acidithiobacillus albertensis TaxID=119978 RepID=UPI001C06A466|nr:hypothetical protein [Acidithiobacillus albertensis]MBU2742513.1 hypothetical protein [Acidithiobacillus albertensis]